MNFPNLFHNDSGVLKIRQHPGNASGPDVVFSEYTLSSSPIQSPSCHTHGIMPFHDIDAHTRPDYSLLPHLDFSRDDPSTTLTHSPVVESKPFARSTLHGSLHLFDNDTYAGLASSPSAAAEASAQKLNGFGSAPPLVVPHQFDVHFPSLPPFPVSNTNPTLQDALSLNDAAPYSVAVPPHLPFFNSPPHNSCFAPLPYSQPAAGYHNPDAPRHVQPPSAVSNQDSMPERRPRQGQVVVQPYHIQPIPNEHYPHLASVDSMDCFHGPGLSASPQQQHNASYPDQLQSQMTLSNPNLCSGEQFRQDSSRLSEHSQFSVPQSSASASYRGTPVHDIALHFEAHQQTTPTQHVSPQPGYLPHQQTTIPPPPPPPPPPPSQRVHLQPSKSSIPLSDLSAYPAEGIVCHHPDLLGQHDHPSHALQRAISDAPRFLHLEQLSASHGTDDHSRQRYQRKKKRLVLTPPPEQPPCDSLRFLELPRYISTKLRALGLDALQDWEREVIPNAIVGSNIVARLQENTPCKLLAPLLPILRHLFLHVCTFYYSLLPRDKQPHTFRYYDLHSTCTKPMGFPVCVVDVHTSNIALSSRKSDDQYASHDSGDHASSPYCCIVQHSHDKGLPPPMRVCCSWRPINAILEQQHKVFEPLALILVSSSKLAKNLHTLAARLVPHHSPIALYVVDDDQTLREQLNLLFSKHLPLSTSDEDRSQYPTSSSSLASYSTSPIFGPSSAVVVDQHPLVALEVRFPLLIATPEALRRLLNRHHVSLRNVCGVSVMMDDVQDEEDSELCETSSVPGAGTAESSDFSIIGSIATPSSFHDVNSRLDRDNPLVRRCERRFMAVWAVMSKYDLPAPFRRHTMIFYSPTHITRTLASFYVNRLGLFHCSFPHFHHTHKSVYHRLFDPEARRSHAILPRTKKETRLLVHQQKALRHYFRRQIADQIRRERMLDQVGPSTSRDAPSPSESQYPFGQSRSAERDSTMLAIIADHLEDTLPHSPDQYYPIYTSHEHSRSFSQSASMEDDYNCYDDEAEQSYTDQDYTFSYDHDSYGHSQEDQYLVYHQP